MRTTSGEIRIASWSAKARIVGVLLTLVLLGLGVSFLYRKGFDLHLAVAQLQSVQAYWWAPGAFVAAYFVLTCLLAPGTLMHLVGGAVWGIQPGLWISLVACNLTCSLHFMGARLFVRQRLRKRFARAGLEELDARAEHSGLLAVLVLRMLPMPMVLANSLAGVSRIRWRDFALGSFVGTLPMVIAFTFFASAIVEGAEGAGETALRRSLTAGVAFALLVGAGHVVRRKVAAVRSRRRKTEQSTT